MTTSSGAQPAVLVTGGAGFIGSGRAALADGDAGRGPRQPPPAGTPRAGPTRGARRACRAGGRGRGTRRWDALLARYRPESARPPGRRDRHRSVADRVDAAREVNVVGTTVMLDALVRHGVFPEHVVLTSSRAVYGEGGWVDADGWSSTRPRAATRSSRPAAGTTSPPRDRPGPLPSSAATTHPNPSSVYGSTKLAQELILRNWTSASRSRSRSSACRTSTDPASRRTTPTPGSSPSSTGSPRRGGPRHLRGRRHRARLHRHRGRGQRTRGGTPGRRRRRPRILDVGTGVVTTIADAARAIAEHHGAPDPQISGKFRDGDVRHAVADVTASCEALGWRRSEDFEAGSAAVAD